VFVWSYFFTGPPVKRVTHKFFGKLSTTTHYQDARSAHYAAFLRVTVPKSKIYGDDLWLRNRCQEKLFKLTFNMYIAIG